MAVEPERFEPGVFGELPPELAFARLPPGRHGLPREFVASNQRLRLIAAMLQTLPRHGYPKVTIAHLTRAAGVSRDAFYTQFEDKEECFLATYDLAARWLGGRIELAAESGSDWAGRVAAGVAEALRLLGANPALTHLIAIDVFQAGPAARRRQEACISALAEALRAGRPGPVDLPGEMEELLVGGVVSLIGRYVDADRADRLTEAIPELVEYLLIPYLGLEETRRVAARAA